MLLQTEIEGGIDLIVRHFTGFQDYQNLHVNFVILKSCHSSLRQRQQVFKCRGVPDGCTTGIVVEIRVHLRNLSAPALNPIRPNSQLILRILSKVLRARWTMKTYVRQIRSDLVGHFHVREIMNTKRCPVLSQHLIHLFHKPTLIAKLKHVSMSRR